MIAGYEKEYSQSAVKDRILKVFENFQKLLISQFESGKSIPDIVKDNSRKSSEISDLAALHFYYSKRSNKSAKL